MLALTGKSCQSSLAGESGGVASLRKANVPEGRRGGRADMGARLHCIDLFIWFFFLKHVNTLPK